MIQLIEIIAVIGLVGAFALGVHKAWDGFKQGIAAPYVQAQIEHDQGIINKADAAQKQAESDRDTARGNSQRCGDTLKVSQAAQSEWFDAAMAADKASKAQAAENAKAAAAVAPKIAQLQADAAAKPKLLACQDELAIGRKALLEAVAARRQPAKPLPGAK